MTSSKSSQSKVSTAIALLALFVALGGTSYAALALPKNSVSTKQVKDHSLMGRDFKSGQIPEGEDGADGAPGPIGAPGSAGAPGPAGTFSAANVRTVYGPTAYLCPEGGGSCQVGLSVATCPAGSVVLGGGWDGLDHPPVNATVGYNDPSGAGAWEVIMANRSSISSTFRAVATCATSSGAPASSQRAPSAAAIRDLARLRAKLAR